MKIEEIILNNFALSYPLSNIAPLEDILFLDIETTGFLSSSSAIYMIGCAYLNEENWCIKQFFAQTKDEEASVLTAFLEFADNFKFLIHYNGNTFDLPFIAKRAEKYELKNTLEGKEGLDIYRRIMTYKSLLKLPDCKLKTIEMFLGFEREDRYSGGELINVYNDYLESRDYDLYHMLVQHNSDDMKGMLEILPVLSYYDLFNEDVTATKAQSNYYTDASGVPRKELLVGFTLPSPVPVPIAFMGKGCHIKVEKDEGTMIVPIYEEELKYFYSNYKDYYYLPLEDTAIHKSIGYFVEKEFREQAKASTCYTRKISCYLPQWEILYEPFFKREYDSTEFFFELTDDIKKDRVLFSKYVSHILNKIAFQK